MRELDVDARVENLPEVQGFISENLDVLDCDEKERNQIEVAAEEIFTNISSYAYNSGVGTAKVRVELDDNPLSVSISFIDGGMQYDPLARQDPDTKLSLKERKRGGLGIFMTKKFMDDVNYEYKNGKNILTISKRVLRQPEVDMAKAIVIFFLATIHVFVECSTDEQLWEGLPYFFDSILGGPWAAPMFIFSMGIGLAFTTKNKPKDLFLRGLNILLVGTFLNLLRFLVPSLFGFVITKDAEFYLEPLAFRVFGNDLLQFAALAMLLMGLLKLLKLTPWKVFFVGLAMSIISMFLNNTWTSSIPLNILLGHFIGVDDGAETVMSDFPLMVWFIVYAAGLVFGGYLKKMKNKKKFYLCVSIPCFIITTAVYIIEYFGEFGMMGGPGANVFYHLTTPEVFLCIGTEFAMLGFYYLIVQYLPKKVMAVIEGISRNVTIVYAIQWVLVWWVADVFIYIFRGSKYLPSWQSLILGLVLSTVSVVFAELWSRSHRNHQLAKKEKALET